MYLETELRSYNERIEHAQKINPKISAVSVGWHIDHILKAIIDPTRFIRKSDPKKFKRGFNVQRTFLFSLGFMPKGIIKAPKSVSAPEKFVNEADLRRQMKLALETVKEWESFDENCWYIHGAIGPLNVKDNIRLLEIHCKHHLQIIDSIIKNSKASYIDAE